MTALLACCLLLLSFLSLSCKAFRYFPSTSSPVRIVRLQLSPLYDWVISQGAKENDIKVFFDTPVCASSFIKKGDVLFSIPLGSCIEVSKTIEKFGSIVNARMLRTGQLGMLALYLLSEKARGSASKLNAYILSLSREGEVSQGILSWSDEELQELSASTTRKISSQLEAIEKDVKLIQSLSSTVFPSSVYNLEQFRWALGVIKSKYVVLEQGSPVLVPGMDSITFDPLGENEPFIASAGFFGGKVVKLVADRDYSKGEQVFMSFGLKSSAESLEDHGVLPDLDPIDASCEMSVAIEDTDKYSDDKITILEDNGFRGTMQFDLLADPESDLDPGLLRFLRLKLISGQDSFILESVFRNTVFRTLDSPFSKSNELAVFLYIQSFCQQAMDTMSRVDEQYDGVVEKSERQLLLSLLRKQEQAALEATLNQAAAAIQNIQSAADKREYYQERRLRELDLLRPLDDNEVVKPWDQ